MDDSSRNLRKTIRLFFGYPGRLHVGHASHELRQHGNYTSGRAATRYAQEHTANVA